MAHESEPLLQCMQNILKSCMMHAYEPLKQFAFENTMKVKRQTKHRYFSSLSLRSIFPYK